MKRLLILVSLLVLLAPSAVAKGKPDLAGYTLDGTMTSITRDGIGPVKMTEENIGPERLVELQQVFGKLGFKLEPDAAGLIHVNEIKKKGQLERFGEWCVDQCDAHPKIVKFTRGSAHVTLWLLNVGGAVGNILRYTM